MKQYVYVLALALVLVAFVRDAVAFQVEGEEIQGQNNRNLLASRASRQTDSGYHNVRRTLLGKSHTIKCCQTEAVEGSEDEDPGPSLRGPVEDAELEG